VLINLIIPDLLDLTEFGHYISRGGITYEMDILGTVIRNQISGWLSCKKNGEWLVGIRVWMPAGDRGFPVEKRPLWRALSYL